MIIWTCMDYLAILVRVLESEHDEHVDYLVIDQ